MIDLHMHSSFSDGTKTPTELVKEARNLGLSAIALTDHDTSDGVTEFMRAGTEFGITTVPGVEISIDTKLPNNGHLHMLGLFIDPDSSDLKNKLGYLRDHRNERAGKIINALNNLGIPITMEELLEEAGEGSIGRPHVAKILVRSGIVSSIQEAFDIYLAKGKPAYMDKIKFAETEAIELIHRANGLAILAHPHFMGFDQIGDTLDKILHLKKLGLDGFEAFYPGMPIDLKNSLLELARECNLIISGGSDYHGVNKPGIMMGNGRNDLMVPDAVLADMQNRVTRTFDISNEEIIKTNQI